MVQTRRGIFNPSRRIFLRPARERGEQSDPTGGVTLDLGGQESLYLLGELIEEATTYSGKAAWMAAIRRLKGELLGIGAVDQGAGAITGGLVGHGCF